MKRKLVCLFLAICLLASFSVTAYAAEYSLETIAVGTVVKAGDTLLRQTDGPQVSLVEFGDFMFGLDNRNETVHYTPVTNAMASWVVKSEMPANKDGTLPDWYATATSFVVIEHTRLGNGIHYVGFGLHNHDWQVNQENAKGTATCSCGAKVTLSAASATTAKTVGECVTLDKTDDVSLAYTVDIRKLGEPGTEAQIVDASCKEEGNYQAWLKLDDTHGLYANFTLTNPTTTAATGDNRPIELLVAGFAAVSIMAAAAFTVDRKRR